MIAKLLKELVQALWRHASFRVAGPRVGSQEGALATPMGTPIQMPAPDPVEEMVPRLREPPPAIAPAVYEPRASFDWQILSRPNEYIYPGGPSLDILDRLVHEPRFILDIGCSSGDFTAKVKERFPRAQIWGIEPNEVAARLAAPRLDRVLCQAIEKVDWAREGVKRGDIDTVFLLDVLEHTYDPWSTLLALRNLVCESAQVVVSIPNVRNVLLMQDLVSGYWRYRTAGLLDITHIRFFTKSDMYRLFYQTGFRVATSGSTLCPGSTEIYRKHLPGKFPKVVQLESASITVQSVEDLESLCAVQHNFALQPVEYDQLTTEERQWIDAPHPATVAFSGN
jgi:SAM-dependent methyltransferase